MLALPHPEALTLLRKRNHNNVTAAELATTADGLTALGQRRDAPRSCRDRGAGGG